PCRDAPFLDRPREALANEILRRAVRARQQTQRDARSACRAVLERAHASIRLRRAIVAHAHRKSPSREPASAAAKTSVMNAPAATVDPIAWSTGIAESESNPKLATVVAFASAREASVRADESRGRAAS